MPYVPIEWLREHVEVPEGTTAEGLASDLVRVGLEEEAIDRSAAVTGPLVVGRVLEVTPEPQKNGKTINWCRVDVGPEHNEHDEATGRGSRGIVCGAHNFGVGDSVVVALPGAVLPGDFAIAARKTYGHVSDGMICSQSELGLGEDHSGIIVLDDPPAPGTDAIALLGLGEEVLEINVTPDRGYCFSMRGVAREYAHSTGAPFTDRALELGARVPVPTDSGFAVEISDDAPIRGNAGADRFVARIVRGVDATAASPAWLSKRLRQAGMRPISLAVDVTNYVMLDLGQPLHAYDLGTLHAPIVVRRAKPGERMTTLDDVDRSLDVEDLLITDSPEGNLGSRPIGIAGVMGGLDTEVGEQTTDILIEAAHFDPISIARTARRHKLPSEASKRFERGVDNRLQAVAAQRVVDLLVELGGGTADESAVTDVDRTSAPSAIGFDPQQASRLVGVRYSNQEVVETLRSLGATVEEPAEENGESTGRHAASTGRVLVIPPSWRPDLTEPADLVEEVVRLRGYDAVPSVLPAAPAGRGLTVRQLRRRRVADLLADSGLVQVLTYPFIPEGRHDQLGLPAEDPRRQAIRLVNPLAQDAPFLRTSLLHTLLEAAVRNVGRGMTDVAIYEIGSVTRPAGPLGSSPLPPPAALPDPVTLEQIRAAVPPQPLRLAAVLVGAASAAGPGAEARAYDAADAVALVRDVARAVGADIRVGNDPQHAPWHPGRCARISTADGVLVGHAGELAPRVVTELGLPARAVALEIDLDVLLAAAPETPRQVAGLSTAPAAKEDIALVVPVDVPAGDVLDLVTEAAGALAEEVRLFDVYTGANLPEGTRSLAFALRLRGERTLTGEDTAAVRDAVVTAAAARFGATLRG
ncbi:phenylalanine--tRNA ligase subunit beta [Pseudactinotalea suaedae]|uniref:phenylalanine--tRNA ligase subunit beta n=1 Tax=Pseudactinotalea suaedae TaxID=1524924 RepID=UPI0012E0F040|nr:phenylalanine--tRNA ligase subunit beta [Pseudactinotalea suaedae]